MSSAKRRVHSGRPPMEMGVWRFVEGLLYDVLQIDVEQSWREEASLANSN